MRAMYDARMFYALFYDYVPDILERRGPHRPGHLALAQEHHQRGELALAGAWSDPVDGALFVFNVADRDMVERFVEHDPYVTNGLVTSFRIRSWNVVVGDQV